NLFEKNAIETIFSAIEIHGREQNLARAAFFGLLDPLKGLDFCFNTPSVQMDEMLSLKRARIDSDDYKLLTECVGELPDEPGIPDSSRIYRDFIGAGQEERFCISKLGYSTADGK